MELDRLRGLYNKQGREGQPEGGLIEDSPAQLERRIRVSRRLALLRALPMIGLEIALIALMVFWLRHETLVAARGGVIVMLSAILLVLPISAMVRLRLGTAVQGLSLMDSTVREHALLKGRITLDRYYTWLYLLPMTIGLAIYLQSARPAFGLAIAYILAALGLFAAYYWHDRRQMTRELMPLEKALERELLDMPADGRPAVGLAPKQRRYLKLAIIFSMIAVGGAILSSLLDLFGYLHFEGVALGTLGILFYGIPYFILHYSKEWGRHKVWLIILGMTIYTILYFAFRIYLLWPYTESQRPKFMGLIELGLGFLWANSITGIFLSVNYFRSRLP